MRDPDFKKKGQYFLTVEEMYSQRLNYLIAFASKHLYQNDAAVDVVHDAVVKSIEYFRTHPGKKVQIRQVEYNILRLCRKHNKLSSIQKTSGLMGINGDSDEIED